MSVLGEAEQLLEVAVPPVRAARWIWKAIVAIAVLAALGFAFWWVMIRPRQAQTAAATAIAGAVIAKHGEAAAVGALGVQNDVNQRRDARRTLNSENDHAIKAAAGASTLVDPDVARALHDALCMRDAYRAEPDCQIVQTAGGRVGVSEADAGSEAAGR